MLEEAVQQYIQIPNCHHKTTQAVEEFDRPSPQQWPPPQQWQQPPSLSESLDDTLQRFLKSEKDKDEEKEREVVEREERKKICVKIKKLRRKREGKKKITEKKKSKKKVREKKKRTREKKKESYEKPLPHPKKNHRKEKKFKCLMEIFKKLEIKVPMIETLQQVLGEFGERSEEGERWNQKRHQKVQKEKPQLPLSGSLPLSGTQEFTLDPLRGKMVGKGKKPTHALTAERHYFWAWA
ncbi:hypothetical protein LR48_Vigan294s001300 [Vigna angularis]|uniref:Uncharacterized protein n=1 Tax=Phaseolus angularis TaxID=3914 RepID=A0A0L9T7M0_PHAAN|nr:hypothetical protein LR48_Vigan294s001300 [Vigna angularis]